MIQISFTRDWHTPQVIWYDEEEEKPIEYPQDFKGYEYLSDEEALKMLEDEFVTKATKDAIRKVLLY